MSSTFTPEKQELLLQFITEKFEREALVQLLRFEFELDGESIWKSGNFKQQAWDLLEHFRKRYDMRSLAFVVLAGKRAHPDTSSLATKLLTDAQQATLRLYTLLKQWQLDEAKIRDAWRAARPLDWLEFWPTTQLERAAIIAFSLAESHAVDSKGRNPLAIFCARLTQSLTEDQRHELEAWWTTSAALLGEPAFAATTDAPDERYSVIVELHETCSPRQDQATWRMQACVYRHQSQQFDDVPEIDPEIDRSAIEVGQAVERLRNHVAAYYQPADLREVIFEFFVSLPSFYHPVDRSILDPELRVELGFENAVVIRSLDRKPAQRNRLQVRWNRMQDKQCLIEPTVPPEKALTFAEEDRGGDPLAHLSRYESNDELQCLILRQPIAQRHDVDEFTCLLAAMRAGIPIILWGRTEEASQQLPKEALSWFQKPPHDLPAFIHSLRRSANDSDHLGRHVTLFYESGVYDRAPNNRINGAR